MVTDRSSHDVTQSRRWRREENVSLLGTTNGALARWHGNQLLGATCWLWAPTVACPGE